MGEISVCWANGSCGALWALIPSAFGRKASASLCRCCGYKHQANSKTTNENQFWELQAPPPFADVGSSRCTLLVLANRCRGESLLYRKPCAVHLAAIGDKNDHTYNKAITELGDFAHIGQSWV